MTASTLFPPRETVDLFEGDRIRTTEPAPGFGIHEQIPAGERAQVLDVFLDRNYQVVIQVRFYRYGVIRSVPLAHVTKIA